MLSYNATYVDQKIDQLKKTMCHRTVSLLGAGYVTGIHFIFTTNFEINNYAPFIFTLSFNSCTHNK